MRAGLLSVKPSAYAWCACGRARLPMGGSAATFAKDADRFSFSRRSPLHTMASSSSYRVIDRPGFGIPLHNTQTSGTNFKPDVGPLAIASHQYLPISVALRFFVSWTMLLS